MGNALTGKNSKGSKSKSPSQKYRRTSDKNYSKLLSKANKLKFHVSHLLTTTITKIFDDDNVPQTGVHAHHHMATHVENEANLINKNRSIVRADSLGEVSLAAAVSLANKQSDDGFLPASVEPDHAQERRKKEERNKKKNPGLPPVYGDKRFPYPWTKKQKFVLTDDSVLQDIRIVTDGAAADAKTQTLMANKLHLCLISNFLLGQHCAECVNRKQGAMKSMLTVAQKRPDWLLDVKILPTVFQVFRANLFYDEIVADHHTSWEDMNLMDEFTPDTTKYYRKEWSDQMVVYKTAFELLACPGAHEPKDADAEALMSELLLHGSTDKAANINHGKMSFVEGLISIILNQNTDSRERKFAVLILDRAVNILTLSDAISKLSNDQKRQQNQSLWRVVHIALTDVGEGPTDLCASCGPVGVKEILKIIRDMIGDNVASSFDDMFNDSAELDAELDGFMGEDSNPREIDVSMLKVTMRVIASLHAVSANSLSWYHNELVMLAVKISLVDEEIACTILRWLLRRWPWSTHKKQILFLHSLERVLDAVWYQEDVIKELLPLMLRVLARVLTAENSKVMKQCLPLFLNEQISTTVWFTHLEHVLPALYPELKHTATTHWDTDSVRVAETILTLLSKLDSGVFSDFQKDFQTKTVEKDTPSDTS